VNHRQQWNFNLLRFAPIFLVGLLFVTGSLVSAAEQLQIFPTEIELCSAGAKQQAMVLRVFEDGTTEEITDKALVTVVDPAIATFHGGSVFSKADGTTTIRAEYEGLAAEVPAKVTNSTQPNRVSFRKDIIPVLTRSGCNSGTCHGSSRGQDGFRISLFGFDPAGDYHRITREAPSRRINLAFPDESLMLQKGMGNVTHTGGKRFEKDSFPYQQITQWLREGALDDPEAARVTRIELFPPNAVLRGIEATQRFVVIGHYADGTRRDVSHLTVFLSRDESVAPITPEGVARGVKRGETFVTARFDVHTVGVPLLVLPSDRPAVPLEASDNFIDQLIAEKNQKLRQKSGPVCDDATFLRRVTLDTIGKLPTREEYERFMGDTNPSKRKVLAESLLARPEAADMWAAEWADLLMIRELPNVMSDKAVDLYFQWLRDQFRENRPLNEVVHELLTASGHTFTEPASNFYAMEGDKLKLSENVAQLFLGIRLQCAQCHNHPFDRWTMDDYYSFAAFFAGVYRKPDEDYRQWTVFAGGGETNHPVRGVAMPPKFLGSDVAPVVTDDRRKPVAGWITSPDNPYFAKNIANRIWARYFGRGIVDQVDDVRVSNPPSNPALYDAIGTKLVEYAFDRQKLEMDIIMSLAYQRSVALPGEESDERNLTHAVVRRIPATILLDCLGQVTGAYDKFRGIPLGSSSLLTRNQAPESYFLQTFGRSQRSTVCACETKSEPTLSQALHMLNGDAVHGKIQRGGKIKSLLDSGRSAAEIYEELYVTSLTRLPTDEEKSKLEAIVASAESPQAGLEDIFWAILNSREFLFNH
jgi:Protein of unknown function (DUF1549)/Protein of unknown function (DUF1553)